jgi:rubrerythrin
MKTHIKIQGTKTEQNIVKAYISESAAYTRYTFYAAQATKEELFPIAKIFADTADNEFHHSKVFFKMLQGGTVGVTLEMDAGIIGDTAANLAIAAHEEMLEGVEQYRNAAITAREEGFHKIAAHFDHIADIEERHRLRFERCLNLLLHNSLWKREEPINWQCLVCGTIVTGIEPPALCPACDHSLQHYMPLDIIDL